MQIPSLIPQPTPFSPSIGNAGVIFDYPLAKVGVAPYNAAWNFGIQRELPWNMFLTASYVGNRDNHLPTTLSLNDQPPPAVLTEFPNPDVLGELVTSPDAIADGVKIPYPEFPDAVWRFGDGGTVPGAVPAVWRLLPGL